LLRLLHDLLVLHGLEEHLYRLHDRLCYRLDLLTLRSATFVLVMTA
jgi:hypothetical protein